MDERGSVYRMVDLNYKYNARHLAEELAWLKEVVKTRYMLYHGKKTSCRDVLEVPSPSLNGCNSLYSEVVRGCRLTAEERLVLILALYPHIAPNLLDSFLKEIAAEKKDTPMLQTPTVDTALFLLAGDNLEKRFYYYRLFEPDSILIGEELITLEQDDTTKGLLEARLVPSKDVLALFTTGRLHPPRYSHEFPAQRITTELEWKDLVLPARTRAQVEEIKIWLKHGRTLLYEWGLKKKIAPGYRCLFHGPPGTGKTLTATLLGKDTGLDVYRIDLSLVVSKFIGETEKNLKKIFDAAHNRDWILFFDEADALFTKRTEVQTAHDRFSNQEVAYLLHRVEEHTGLVILATNRKSNLDEAFLRRFQCMIEFPMPTKQERLRIWQKGFSEKSVLEKAVNLEELAERYELTGASIMNVVRYASLMALNEGSNVIRASHILKGIEKEYTKEGRTI